MLVDDDVIAFHDIDAEKELTEFLSKQIHEEIEKEIYKKMNNNLFEVNNETTYSGNNSPMNGRNNPDCEVHGVTYAPYCISTGQKVKKQKIKNSNKRVKNNYFTDEINPILHNKPNIGPKYSLDL